MWNNKIYSPASQIDMLSTTQSTHVQQRHGGGDQHMEPRKFNNLQFSVDWNTNSEKKIYYEFFVSVL